MKKDLKLLFQNLEKLKSKVVGILLYGSYAKNESTIRSDIDVCVVAGTHSKKKLKSLYRDILQISGINEKYDIRIFELIPLYLKHEIITQGRVIWAKNLPELYYYFYFYRKLWQDQAVNRIELKE